MVGSSMGFWVPPVATAVATPPNTGYYAWWDPSDAATLTISTGVSQQNDKSGNGFHMSNGTGAEQPSSVANTISGLTAITYDGSDDSLLNASFSFAQTTITFFCVFKAVGSSGRVVSMTSAANADWNSADGCELLGLGGDWGTLTQVQGVSNGSFSTTNPTLYTMTRNGTSMVGRVNGSQFATNGSISSSAWAPDKIRFGGMGGGGTYSNVILGEILIYTSVLSGADITATEAYLKAKWGTP